MDVFVKFQQGVRLLGPSRPTLTATVRLGRVERRRRGSITDSQRVNANALTHLFYVLFRYFTVF